ncbi:MAG: ABC transporter permease [Dehalococcoidia bacterium]|nr:ABC transporter permease [Dehalococcoidia bacterium]MDW8119514.1 ABC transporter permease [Chloroflexota bacterium]
MDRPRSVASAVSGPLRGRPSVVKGIARFLRQKPVGAVGAVLVLLLVVTAVFAPLVAPHAPKETAFPAYLAPQRDFWMGTDNLGRDVLSRVLWGARLSLYVGLVSVLVGVTVGALWGVITAYFGGAIDAVSQRVVDSLMAFPPILLALGLMAILGQSVNNVIIALVVLLAPTAARTVRASALSVMAMPYIEAARAMGCSPWRIIFRHVVPNVTAPYLILVSVNIGYAIVVEASLSFLGVGVPPDEPSWGGMVTAGAKVLERAPWIALFPGAAISLTVFGFNLFGDAVRDYFDPRLRGA